MTVRKDSVLRIGRLVLLALVVMLTVACVMALADRGAGHREITDLLDRYTATLKADSSGKDDDKEKDQSKDKPKGGKKPNQTKSPQDEQVERICKRHVFSPDQPNKLPNLIGVLGNEAFFGGEKGEKGKKGYKVGEIYKGVKIKEIGPDWVEVEFEGKPKKLYVFSGEDVGPSSPSGPSSHMPPGVRAVPNGGATQRTRMMPPGFEVTPEMIEKFKSLSPEKRKQALERMPAEFREKIEKAL